MHKENKLPDQQKSRTNRKKAGLILDRTFDVLQYIEY